MGDAPNSGPGTEPKAGTGDLDRRRRALETGLHGAQRRHDPPQETISRGHAIGMGFRMATELLAGLLVGGVMGWYLDAWLGTGPFLFLFFLALGAVAGTRNVFRHAYRLNRAAQQSEDDAGHGPEGSARH